MELLIISLLASLGFSLSGLFGANEPNDEAASEDSDFDRYEEPVGRTASELDEQDTADTEEKSGSESLVEENPDLGSVQPNENLNGIVVRGHTNVVGSNGDDTISGWHNLFGGAGDDTIIANNFGGEYQAAGSAFGGSGDDTIVAHGGHDGDGQLYGGVGDDILIGRAGAYFDGGDGDDTVVATASSLSDGEVVLGSGRDLILVEGFSIGGESRDAGYAANITIEDFSVDEDRLGILIKPADLENLTYSKDLVNEGSDTRITLFFSNSLNDIEVNSPIQIIISGVTETENLIFDFYTVDASGSYQPFSSAVLN